MLTTTSQGKGIDTRKQFIFDICLEIKGFSKENSFEYIRKHFRHVGTEHSSKGERLIEEVEQNPLLSDLSRNPLNLLLLCVFYEDHEGSLPSSFTDLYQTIVRCFLRRYCAREELKASEKDEDLDKQFEVTIVALGELAWKCLLNDRFSFYEDELEELERSNENIVALRPGFVYMEESLKRYKSRHAYSFLHKTFQDYLAASYIAHKFRGSEFQMLEQMLSPEIARRNFKQVFVFVWGILREEANIPFEQIGNMQQKQWDWLKCITRHTELEEAAKHARSSVPAEIRDRGPETERTFQKAMRTGKVKVYRGRIMLLGQDRAGKTSLKKSLLGFPFDPKEECTVGVEVDRAKCELEVDKVENWMPSKRKKREVSEFEEAIAKFIVKDLTESEIDDNGSTSTYPNVEEVKV